MAFPPNYNQERSNRARGKARKALDKQLKREEKNAQRKAERPQTETDAAVASTSKDQD